MKLTHEDMLQAKLPMAVYGTVFNSDGDSLSGYVEEILVTAYGMSHRTACVASVCVSYPSGVSARASVGMFFLTQADAQEEIDEALKEHKENPPYQILKQQRDEAVAALEAMTRHMQATADTLLATQFSITTYLNNAVTG